MNKLSAWIAETDQKPLDYDVKVDGSAQINFHRILSTRSAAIARSKSQHESEITKSESFQASL